MSSILKYCLITCFGIALLDTLSFALLPYLPEDAVFNLGPTMGLLMEHRMVDLLVYKEFNTYYGYPPLFFIIQGLWYWAFGYSVWSMASLLIFIHVLIVVTFFYILKDVLLPYLISLFSIIFFSCIYFTSGRPDPLVIVLILLLVVNMLKMLERMDNKRLVISSFLLLLIFFIHPLAFIISSFIFYATLFGKHGFKALKVLLISAVTLLLGVGLIYVPFVLSDLPSWNALFVKLAQRQDHFNLSALAKFLALNLGTVSCVFAIFLFAPQRFLSFLKSSNSWVIGLGFLLTFFFGMSYYYLYPFVFLLISILFFFRDQIQASFGGKKVVIIWTIYALSALISLYQGSGGKIIQGIRRPDFANELSVMRDTIQNMSFGESPVYVDYQLVLAVPQSTNLNLFWHGMKYFRSEPAEGSYFIFHSEKVWTANQSLLGSLQDSTQYETILRMKPVKGLPSLYSMTGSGPDMELSVIRKKK